MKMTKPVINQETIDFFDAEAEDFFQKIFQTTASAAFLTDIAQLKDFNTFYIPEQLNEVIESEVAQAQKPGMTKDEQWKTYSRIYNRHWDKWVTDQIKEVYAVEVDVYIYFVDLFRLLASHKKSSVLH
jgi:hypothetical protein